MEQLKKQLAQAKSENKKSLTVDFFLDAFMRDELKRLGYSFKNYKSHHNGIHFEYSEDILWD